MIGFGQPEAADLLSLGEQGKPFAFLFFRPKSKNRIHNERALDAYKAPQPAVAAFKFLHHETVRDVVHGEDLLLCQPLFEKERDKDLIQLSFDGPVRCEEEVARQLLGDRAGSADPTRTANTVNYCTYKADRIYSPVGEEMLIFRSRQRVHQHFWQIVVFDDAALFPGLIVEIRHQFGRKPWIAIDSMARFAYVDGSDARRIAACSSEIPLGT